MRKFELFFDIDSEKEFVDLNTLETKFKKLLESKVGGFIRPIDNLKIYQKTFSVKQQASFKYRFLSFLIKNYDRILVLKPNEMQNLINRMDRLKLTENFYKKKKNGKYGQTKFCTRLLKELRYEEALGGGSRGKDLARMINIRACSYCNSQYTFSYKYDKKKISKLQLDHFFSKSKYPYLSISLYNLIPSCSYCNQKKSNKGFNLSEYSHPYEESFSDRFKFKLSPASEKKLIAKYKIEEKEIDIILEHTNDIKVINHDDIFDLSGIYSNHKNIVKTILKTSKAYPKRKIKEILDLKDEHGNPLFSDEQEFKRTFLNVPLNENEINTEPISKLKQDFMIK